MSDPNRLNDLRRQRALVAEQLAWLDREIAAAEGVVAPVPVSPATKPPIVATQSKPNISLQVTSQPEPAANPAVEAAADAIFQEYRVAPDAMKSDVKKGCFLYFFAALALVAVGVVALYLLFRHGK